MSYDAYLSDIFPEFQQVHHKFINQYQLEDISNYYYDFDTGLLTLSNDSNEVNFRFILVGSFSETSRTWLWAWDRNDTLPVERAALLEIKVFGEQKGFEKLSSPQLDSDEYDGWQFIAFAQHVLGGIGGYKVQSEHVHMYMLVTEFVEYDVANEIKSATVHCETHGKRRAAFVCQHLVSGGERALGFEESFPTYHNMPLGEDDDFSAWCDDCEKYRLEHDGWNKTSEKFADIRLVCEECYFDLKQKHSF